MGDSSKATWIGAGVGALAGGVAGYYWSGIKKDVEQSGATDLGVSVTEMPDGSLRVNLPSHVSFDVGKANRSEERRVGKECRCRSDHNKLNKNITSERGK